MYYPAHQYFLRAIPSTATVTEGTGAIANAPSIGSAFDVGYTSPGDVTSGEGTKMGYAAGRRGGSYGARGARTHSLTANLRLGSVEFIKDNCLNAETNPPKLDLFFGVSALWAEALYIARCSRCSLNFSEGGAQELTANATFEAIARAAVSPVTIGYDFEEFGPALLWTDVRAFSIGATPIRDKVMGISVDIDHQLERKGVRPDFGDNVPGSRTSYDLLPHHSVITGNLSLHDLPTIQAGLFSNSAAVQDWSDITIAVNDIATTRIYDVTIHDPRPVARQQAAVGSEAQMSFTVPFVASSISVATSRT